MIEQLHLHLILIGCTIGLVLLYLWRQTQRIGRLNLALIQLNETADFDAPAFLRAAWPLLSQAGWRGIEWRLDWFGIAVEERAGRLDGKRLARDISVEDMRLSVSLYARNHGGEQRYFRENLFETFLLLLRTDMWIKAGTTHATFTQMAKLNLFLQHDMKNIAQFIQLMADQLTTIPPGKEQQVLDHLRRAAPMIRQRADRIVRTLTVKQPQTSSIRTFRLRDELEQLSSLHRLHCIISGDATIQAPENTIENALDNILKNYSDLALRNIDMNPSIRIDIAQTAQDVQIIIESSNAAPPVQIERLFEPFWSSDPAGLGIGLYQARHLLQNCQGKLHAQQTTTGQVRFTLSLPLIFSQRV
jgi:signal transduction histidine kinase